MRFQYRVPWTVNITLRYGQSGQGPADKIPKAVSSHRNGLDPSISLLTPEDIRDQDAWDEEFQRRQHDLERQQLQSRERRRRVSAKMDDLKRRWEGVERRRDIRSRQSNRPSFASREVTMDKAASDTEAVSTTDTTGQGSQASRLDQVVSEVSATAAPNPNGDGDTRGGLS